jgi:hypothetical protein
MRDNTWRVRRTPYDNIYVTARRQMRLITYGEHCAPYYYYTLHAALRSFTRQSLGFHSNFDVLFTLLRFIRNDIITVPSIIVSGFPDGVHLKRCTRCCVCCVPASIPLNGLRVNEKEKKKTTDVQPYKNIFPRIYTRLDRET